MIDDATIKRVAEEKIGHRLTDDGKLFADCEPHELVEFARAIEQLARQEQREEIAAWYAERGYLLDEGDIADAIRASEKDNSNV